MSLSTDTPRWVIVYGLETDFVLNGANIHNLDLYKSSAIAFTETFNSITMNNLSFENITVDTDTSIVMFESLEMLHLNGATFSNISSSSSESINNFMIEIGQTGKIYTFYS